MENKIDIKEISEEDLAKELDYFGIKYKIKHFKILGFDFIEYDKKEYQRKKNETIKCEHI